MTLRGSPRILVLDPNPHDGTAVSLALRQNRLSPSIQICRDLEEFEACVESTDPRPDVVVCAHDERRPFLCD